MNLQMNTATYLSCRLPLFYGWVSVGCADSAASSKNPNFLVKQMMDKSFTINQPDFWIILLCRFLRICGKPIVGYDIPDDRPFSRKRATQHEQGGVWLPAKLSDCLPKPCADLRRGLSV